MSEVSSSVAETNRMRAEMGLPPLAISSSEDRAAQAAAARAADEAAVERARVDAIRAELARRKEARIINARVSGQSLGESLVSATAGSARDWIERSRKLGSSEAAKAAALVANRAAAEKAAINDEAYTSSALTGVKVAHSASDFATGSSVILTLKDSRLLAGGAGDALNDEEDELLNADLVESEKLRENSARKAGKSLKHAARFDGAHDDEESELLAKYSETKAKEGIRLGASGQLTAEEQDFQSNRALYEQDDARRKLNQLVYSLDDGAAGVLGAEKDRVYQTDFKEVKFKKKKGSGKAAAATGVAAMDESADAPASAASAAAGSAAPAAKKRTNRKVKAPTESLLDFLPEPSAEDRASELSSRAGGPQSSAKQRREAEEARLAKEEKDARYLRAIQTAEHKTAQRSALDKIQAQEFAEAAASAPAAASGSFVPPPPSSAPPAAAFKSTAAPAFGSAGFVPPPPPPMPAAAAAAAMPAMAPPPGLWEEEEDLELAATLARARRIAAQQRKKHEGAEANDGEEKNGGESNGSSAKSNATDSVRALADRVKEQRAADLIRVKQEPVEEDGVADPAAATAAASSSAAAAPAARSAPPGMRVKSEGASSGLVFTTTTEFVRGLQFDREDASASAKAVKKEEPAAAAAAASGAQAMDLDEKKVSVQDGDDDEGGDAMKDDRDGDQGASSSGSDDSDSDGGLRADEPYARTGVAAALALYKSRGILKEGGNGRRSAEDIAGDKFNLGKYDAFGREQSKKEQFRALSHRFHGIEPGLNKQEKRLQKVQEEAQRIQALRESGGVSNKVAERTKASGAAHVVLDKSSTLLQASGGGDGGGGAEDGAEGAGQKRKKHAGPFAQFGFGKGSFKKRKAAQEADAKKKAAAGGGAAADTMQ